MDTLTDEQLDALARHAEWGHLEGQDYDSIPKLVAELRQLRVAIAAAIGAHIAAERDIDDLLPPCGGCGSCVNCIQARAVYGLDL